VPAELTTTVKQLRCSSALLGHLQPRREWPGKPNFYEGFVVAGRVGRCVIFANRAVLRAEPECCARKYVRPEDQPVSDAKEATMPAVTVENVLALPRVPPPDRSLDASGP